MMQQQTGDGDPALQQQTDPHLRQPGLHRAPLREQWMQRGQRGAALAVLHSTIARS
jgi:hypothetical protein